MKKFILLVTLLVFSLKINAQVVKSEYQVTIQLVEDLDFTLVKLVSQDNIKVVDYRCIDGNIIELNLYENTKYTLDINGSDPVTFTISNRAINLLNKEEIIAVLIE